MRFASSYCKFRDDFHPSDSGRAAKFSRHLASGTRPKNANSLPSRDFTRQCAQSWTGCRLELVQQSVPRGCTNGLFLRYIAPSRPRYSSVGRGM
jgi:hypothetical protein